LKEYEGKVKLVLKMYPYRYRDFSHLAAQALLSAWEQGRHGEMHDIMIENSPRLDKTSLIQYATLAGLDTDRFKRDLDGMSHIKAIERDIRLAKDMDLYSTPAFFINGRKHLGNRPYEYFKKVVDDELAALGRK
jgi:protein-disulfide isomerase